MRLLCATLLALAVLATASIAGAKTRILPERLSAHGSVEQVYVTGVGSKSLVKLVNARGVLVGSRHADSLGGVVFRRVTPGRGYRVRQAGGATVSQSAPLTVLSDRSAPVSTKIYNQRIPSQGYGYLTTRDGTKLAIDVHLPAGNGPYPTLVEYSGYGYADPAGPQNGIAAIANLLGFAVVDVNVRGTGCSGGSFDFFEQLQDLDGYDVIEAVARQRWVLHHRVGMMGISYGGFSQLFVAETDPPHLAAIAPLSVFDNSATALLYAGGILNTDFALTWVQQRDHDAAPASATGGQPWALKRIQDGDQTCKADQVLHGEAVNLVRMVYANRYDVPSVVDPLAPITFVHKIRVPVYLACQWTDEQTGGHCPDIAQHFTGTHHKWFTFTNGVHGDSLDPATLTRWYDFLELFVARRAPHLSAAVRAEAPVVYATALGVPNVQLPADPIESRQTYAAALHAFEALPQVRVMFDNGAGNPAAPGSPVPAFEQSFSRFPIPGTQARSWYLSAGGGLLATVPTRAAADQFTWDKHALGATDFSGNDGGGSGGLWSATPVYGWDQNPPGTAASYLTAPLSANTVVIGGGAVQLWLRASVPSVDLQVTVTEVRPDGKETFGQNGWLRASERKLDPGQSTLLEPVPSFSRADVAPLPTGRFTELTVPLYYEGHAYRKGSRIRIIVSAPGGDQPVWAFTQTVPAGKATVTIGHGPKLPSRVILPVVPGLSVPSGLPPCPGLRGEPCRTYQPYLNSAGSLRAG
jgi:predicted acyl esterase